VDEIIDFLQSAGRNRIPIKPLSEQAMFSVTNQENMTVPEPKDRPTIDDVLTEISSQEWYKQQIQYRRVFEAKAEQIGILIDFFQNDIPHPCDDIPAVLDSPLSVSILQALKDSRNISVLYTHQVAAINAVEQRKHVIVSTSTASGKSIIYQVRQLQF
jgi:DEAD/DEAH box helicase domain-containing protein